MKILYLDLDNVLVDFPSAFPHIDPDLKATYADRIDDIPGIFILMRPMDQAVESFDEHDTIFDTYTLSKSPWNNPSAWSDNLLWEKKHFWKSAYKRLILSHHKNLNMDNYLVVDRTKNVADCFL